MSVDGCGQSRTLEQDHGDPSLGESLKDELKLTEHEAVGGRSKEVESLPPGLRIGWNHGVAVDKMIEQRRKTMLLDQTLHIWPVEGAALTKGAGLREKGGVSVCSEAEAHKLLRRIDRRLLLVMAHPAALSVATRDRDMPGPYSRAARYSRKCRPNWVSVPG
jgi:hypothetical protein